MKKGKAIEFLRIVCMVGVDLWFGCQALPSTIVERMRILQKVMGELLLETSILHFDVRLYDCNLLP